jgi:hypothetical protein
VYRINIIRSRREYLNNQKRKLRRLSVHKMLNKIKTEGEYGALYEGFMHDEPFIDIFVYLNKIECVVGKQSKLR